MPKLTAIAAVAANGVIGDGVGLPWNIPEDFARFKAVTMGGALLMGRATYQSLGRPLPGRTSIVMTRDAAWQPDVTPRRKPGDPLTRHPARSEAQSQDPPVPEVIAVHSVDEALRVLATIDKPWWVIGGGHIYRAMWPYTTDLDLTLVHQTPAGSVTFPALGDDWVETSREPHDGYDFVTYERRGA